MKEFPKDHKIIFKQIQKSILGKGISLVRAMGKDGKERSVLCVMMWNGENTVLVPVAELYDDDPMKKMSPIKEVEPMWIGNEVSVEERKIPVMAEREDDETVN